MSDISSKLAIDSCTGTAMAIEVRCACGQLVYAAETFAGQHVQCPHCLASVAVPVAKAALVPPTPTGGSDARAQAIGAVIVSVVILVLVFVFSDKIGGGLVKFLGLGAALTIIGGLAVAFGGGGKSPLR